jgi:hypothetical protein
MGMPAEYRKATRQSNGSQKPDATRIVRRACSRSGYFVAGNIAADGRGGGGGGRLQRRLLSAEDLEEALAGGGEAAIFGFPPDTPYVFGRY